MKSVISFNEIDAFQKMLDLISSLGHYDGESRDVSNVVVSVPFTEAGWDQFFALLDGWSVRFPSLASFGWARAKRAYTYKGDTITKPSYRKRLHRFSCVDKSGEVIHVDQINTILDQLSSTRCSYGACFSVYSPADPQDAFRPGYVPCIHGGFFRIVQNQLSMTVWFRSQSSLEFGLQDIYHLRQLQLEILSRLHETVDSSLQPGEMCLFFGRIFVPRRVARSNRVFSQGETILEEARAFLLDFDARSMSGTTK